LVVVDERRETVESYEDLHRHTAWLICKFYSVYGLLTR
jgi:hypothetical protein